MRSFFLDRFWAKVDTNAACWLWRGYCAPDGYGRFSARTPRGRRPLLAHVVAWELENGPVPSGLELDHLCRVTACVNPDHLEPVTHRENILRGDRRAMGRHQTSKTHCPAGHRYTPENTYRGPNTWRQCRRCRTDAKRRSNTRYADVA